MKIIEACDSSGNGLEGLISQISAQRRGAASFNPITEKDLGAIEFPPRRWVIPDLITEGLTILAGRPKVGKSWLALNWSVAVATGGIALDKFKVEQAEVLFLALEDSRRRLQERLRKIIPFSDLPAALHLDTIGSLPRSNQSLSILDGWLKKYPGVKLTVPGHLGKSETSQGKKRRFLSA